MLRCLLAAWFVLLSVAPVAAAKSYRAERFDSRVVAERDGSIRVTDTIVFRFEDGSFTHVFRRIPTRRTDGIEFVSATMDGQPFTLGRGPGFINMRRNEGMNIEWRFAPIGPSTHTFEVTYIVRGVARRGERGDVLAWHALPISHEYTIDTASIELMLPAAAGVPVVKTRRVGFLSPASSGERVSITGRDIGKNGWIEITAMLPHGSLLTSPPAWQQRHAVHQRYRDRMLLIGGGIFLAGLVLLFGVRQHYDSPPADLQASAAFGGPPDTLPPALAGALTSNGRPLLEHALAAIFDLASRGVVQVHEGAKTWGVRHFEIVRGASRHPLAAHEHLLLETIFSAKGAEHGRVPLTRAKSQISRRFSKFRLAVEEELLAAGLVDPARRQVRKRYMTVAGVCFGLALLAGVAVAMFVERIVPWLLTIPGALVLLSVTALIFAGAHTPLSNDGVRRAAQWRAFKKHLRDVPRTDGAVSLGESSPASLLPLAVALGLGVSWAKLFKHRAADLPSWFHALSSADANGAFVAFVGTGGAGAHGGGSGGAGGAGAAGGGSSGAG